jgi:hypothetical protein
MVHLEAQAMEVSLAREAVLAIRLGSMVIDVLSRAGFERLSRSHC